MILLGLGLLKNILCLFDDEVLPLEFGHLVANNVTYGHRFMASFQLIVKTSMIIELELTKNYVMLDRIERQEIIWQQLQSCAKK